MSKLAFVVPRYGASIGGGAETLMRSLALALRVEGIEVDILTTCAKDHRTWQNYYLEGAVVEDGLTINRFKVDDRDISQFLICEQKIAKGLVLSNTEQIEWLKNSVNSSSLYQFLVDNECLYDLVFFAPYLFGTSFWGSMLVKEKAILVPCLHDEPYAYLPVMRTLFRSVRGVMWNAHPEAELASRIYSLNELNDKGFEVGMGFEETKLPRVKRLTTLNDQFFLYSGRKETGKGLDILLKYYEEHRSKNPDSPPLFLIGSGIIDFLDSLPEGVQDLGFVSEEKKLDLMTNAICLFQPSVNESFSIVLMEAWGQRTPVLVNSDCNVTSYHVEKSNGGLSFRGPESFSEAVSRFTKDENFRIECGNNGSNYVNSFYSWSSVLGRFKEAKASWLGN